MLNFNRYRILFVIALMIMLPVLRLAAVPCFAGNDPINNAFTGFVSKDSLHNPKKAAILSACLPGAGQAYNKKYWKMPIVYAAGFAGGYMIHTNHQEYKKFRMAYIYRTDTLESTVDDLPKYSEQQLKVFREYYRRNLELSVLLTGVVYLIQILDATVDAHLFDFDVSNNVAVHCRPSLIPTTVSKGFFAPSLTFTVNFSTSRPIDTAGKGLFFNHPVRF
jgi:hypothetical protein